MWNNSKLLRTNKLCGCFNVLFRLTIKMKTLFLITTLDQGGIETYLLRYLEYYQEHEAIVICKSGGFGELYPQLPEW